MDIPSFSVHRVLNLRNRLVTNVFLPLYQCTLEGDDIANLVDQLSSYVPRAPRDALFETCRSLAGQVLTPAECLRFAWRLAGNLPQLNAGKPVRPWATQVQDEWVALRILRMDRGRNRRQDLGFHTTFRVMAGSSCPMSISRFLSMRFCAALSRRVGFTKRTGKLPYTDGRQFVNLQLLGRVEAAKSVSAPAFFEVHCSSGCLTHNRRILEKRLRVEPCPNKWTHPCHLCAIGYETCPAATHARTYIEATCDGCGQMSYFDPEQGLLRCVNCSDRENTRRQET